MIQATILTLLLAAAPAEEKTLRVYFVGNSVTDTINYRGLAELAKSRGYKQVWGRHMIPGAPLQWIWQHPKDGFQEPPFGHYPNALANFQWDVLSLQPFDRHLDGKDGDIVMAKNFIDLALPKSPDLQVYVYARWPRQGKDDFDTAWLKKYTGGWDNTNETKDYFERLTLELRKAYPKLKKPIMVPVGHVMYELNQRMKAGQVPGYTRHQATLRGRHPPEQRRLLRRRLHVLRHALQAESRRDCLRAVQSRRMRSWPRSFRTWCGRWSARMNWRGWRSLLHRLSRVPRRRAKIRLRSKRRMGPPSSRSDALPVSAVRR